MAQAEFSLQEKDKKRLIKDRLVRLAVTSGGVGVLAALILIFVYLAMVIIPLFFLMRRSKPTKPFEPLILKHHLRFQWMITLSSRSF